MRRSIVLLAVGCAAIIFVLSALWSAYYLPAVEMTPGWCLEGEDIETGENSSEWHCVDFRSTLDECIYYHNVSMRDRNTYWVWFMLLLGGLLGWLGHRLGGGEKRFGFGPGGAFALGVASVLVGPLILGAILPAPAEWFPEFVRQAHDTRVAEALRTICR